MQPTNTQQQKENLQPLFYLLMGTAIFLLPLIHAWMHYPLGLEHSQTHSFALGGIFPRSDASAYYSGANFFLDTGFLDAWNTRRPLNTILFSIRLWLTNDNFKTALIIQALLCGMSCVLVTNCIARRFGKITGMITLFILFIFASVFIPTTLSETLGLTLGCLAFVFLWEAIQTKKKISFFNAGLMLIVSLNTRAGAFVLLPLLILWLGYHFNWKMSGVFITGLLSGLLFNIVLIKLYSDPMNTGAMHGNLAHTIYGLVSGGKTWSYAYIMFPELSSKPEAEFAKFLYKEAFKQFKENPTLLLLGLLKGWGGLMKGLISFFQPDFAGPFIFKLFIRLLGFLTYIFGIWRLINLYQSYKTEIGLVGITLLGMFLSAGIIWSDGGFRVFAATVPFFAVAIGIIFGTRLPLSTQTKRNTVYDTPVITILSYTLLLASLIAPPLIQLLQSSRITPHFSCARNENAIITKRISSVPYIDLSNINAIGKFKKNIMKNANDNTEVFLKILEPHTLINPMTLGLVYDEHTKSSKYIVAPPNVFLVHSQWTGLCASPVPGTKNLILQVKSFGALNEK